MWSNDRFSIIRTTMWSTFETRLRSAASSGTVVTPGTRRPYPRLTAGNHDPRRQRSGRDLRRGWFGCRGGGSPASTSISTPELSRPWHEAVHFNDGTYAIVGRGGRVAIRRLATGWTPHRLRIVLAAVDGISFFLAVGGHFRSSRRTSDQADSNAQYRQLTVASCR